MNSVFDSLIISQLPLLKPVALKLTRDREDAADLFQETVYRAFRYRDMYQAGTNMGAWLYTIMRNTFINDYRRQNRIREIVANESPKDFFKVDYSESGENRIVEKELLNTIQCMAPIFRSAFLLYIEGYKYEEIAQKLNQPVGTIKSRIHFARKFLRKKISRN